MSRSRQRARRCPPAGRPPRRPGPPSRLAGLALALLVPLSAGCVGLERGGLYRAEWDRVHVAYFVNETFYRDVEFEFTEALVAEVLASAGLVLSGREGAEVVLTGRVLDVRQRVLAEDRQREPLAKAVEIVLEVRVEDARTGDVLRKATLRETGEFVLSKGETLASGQREAYRFLARDAVRLLEKEF